MKEKLKSFLLNDQFFYGVLIILVGCLSFYLGRLSVIDQPKNDSSKIEFIEPEIALNSKSLSATSRNGVDELIKTNSNEKTDGTVVASKNGTRYYLSTCSGAKRIKPENLITFPTVEEAKIAGYTKALNCPGL